MGDSQDFDFKGYLGAVERRVSWLEREGKPAAVITLTCNYATTAEDLWQAITDSEHVPRWFLPLSGELKLGGRYQLEGNASGEITACTRPSHLALTWEFGEDLSWVEINCIVQQEGTVQLELKHTGHLSPHWDEYGPGAAGVGWDMAFLGLARYLAHPTKPKLDATTFVASADGEALIKSSGAGWEQAAIAAGTKPDVAHDAARRTTAFYTGKPIDPA